MPAQKIDLHTVGDHDKIRPRAALLYMRHGCLHVTFGNEAFFFGYLSAGSSFQCFLFSANLRTSFQSICYSQRPPLLSLSLDELIRAPPHNMSFQLSLLLFTIFHNLLFSSIHSKTCSFRTWSFLLIFNTLLYHHISNDLLPVLRSPFSRFHSSKQNLKNFFPICRSLLYIRKHFFLKLLSWVNLLLMSYFLRPPQQLPLFCVLKI